MQLALPAQLAPVELMLFGPLGWDGMTIVELEVCFIKFYQIYKCKVVMVRFKE